MENKLKALFDFQRFENNSKLAKVISETENRYSAELSDDDLFMVAAAGNPAQLKPDDEKEKRRL